MEALKLLLAFVAGAAILICLQAIVRRRRHPVMKDWTTKERRQMLIKDGEL